MLLHKVVGIFVGLLLPLNYVFGEEWSHGEIRAVGKNLVSMAAFYITCDKKELVELNAKAARWQIFMGTKYLVIGGIESEQPEWVSKGSKGILIEDPTQSEKTMEVEFSKGACSNIKTIADTSYKIGNNYISGTHKAE